MEAYAINNFFHSNKIHLRKRYRDRSRATQNPPRKLKHGKHFYASWVAMKLAIAMFAIPVKEIWPGYILEGCYTTYFHYKLISIQNIGPLHGPQKLMDGCIAGYTFHIFCHVFSMVMVHKMRLPLTACRCLSKFVTIHIQRELKTTSMLKLLIPTMAGSFNLEIIWSDYKIKQIRGHTRNSILAVLCCHRFANMYIGTLPSECVKLTGISDGRPTWYVAHTTIYHGPSQSAGWFCLYYVRRFMVRWCQASTSWTDTAKMVIPYWALVYPREGVVSCLK